MTKKIVGVIYGGKSSERDVSIMSAKEIVANIDKEKYSVVEIKISKDGKFSENALNNIDLVFNALHGKFGEDGVIQGYLETRGIKYTGPGVLSSAVGMDKELFKKILVASNIKTPDYFVIDDLKQIEEFDEKYPLFVKPIQGGSSVASGIASNDRELRALITEALKVGDRVLVEQYVLGKELTCPVLGNSKILVLPVVEIVPNKSNFFDYKSKYDDNGAQEIVPARISQDKTELVQKLSETMYKLIRCRGYSRFDFIMDERGEVWVLEVNTLPGLTKNSLLPKSAKAFGMDYKSLLDKIIEYALD